MPGDSKTGGYPCHVACLLCNPSPVFFTLDKLAEHYIEKHPISRLVTK